MSRGGIILADGGVDDLADREGDHGGLVGAGLGLGDDRAVGDDGEHGALLDGGGLLKQAHDDQLEPAQRHHAHVVAAVELVLPQNHAIELMNGNRATGKGEAVLSGGNSHLGRHQ